MAHRNDRPGIDLSRVFATFLGDKEFMDAAWDEFCSLVDPADEVLENKDDNTFLHHLFHEWVLFDYDIHGGKTPLEKFVTWPPADVGANQLAVYAQAAATQFTSSFLVRGYNEASHKVALENVADGRLYRVFDPVFTDTMEPDHGMLCARIMRVRGIWAFAGNIISYQEKEPEQQTIDDMRDPDGEHNDDFFAFVNAIYGRPPLSAADAIASGFSALTPEERAERLATAQEEYAELQGGLELDVTWDDLTGLILKEDGEGSPVTLMDSIVGQERVDAMGQDELVRALRPIMAAWNLLPHDILDGRTPVEDFEARHPLEDEDAASEAEAVPEADVTKVGE